MSTLSPPLEITPYSPMPFDDGLIEKVRLYIGRRNLRWFRLLRHRHREIPLSIRLNYERKRIPAHPIHYREGMQIRNFMRGLPECKDWKYENFSDTWRQVVSAAIDKEFSSPDDL